MSDWLESCLDSLPGYEIEVRKMEGVKDKRHMGYSANVHMNYDCTVSNIISRRRYFDKQIDW